MLQGNRGANFGPLGGSCSSCRFRVSSRVSVWAIGSSCSARTVFVSTGLSGHGRCWPRLAARSHPVWRDSSTCVRGERSIRNFGKSRCSSLGCLGAEHRTSSSCLPRVLIFAFPRVSMLSNRTRFCLCGAQVFLRSSANCPGLRGRWTMSISGGAHRRRTLSP